MKYKLRDLYVAQLKNNYNEYFILERTSSFDNEVYREVPNNRRFPDKKDLYLAPFKEFFPPKENITTVSEKELLRKKAQINGKYNYEGEVINGNKIKQCLEVATERFFSQNGARFEGYDFVDHRDLILSNLPYNLENNLWLAQILRTSLIFLSKLSLTAILHFIKTSPFFEEKRHDYKLRVIKNQINDILRNRDRWLYSEKKFNPTTEYDFIVRKKIVDTLLKNDMSIDITEEGIEKNTEIWRDEAMDIVFGNIYEPYFSNSQGISLEPTSLEFKEKWLKMRKYEYYQMHKDSVDKYGTIEPSMLLSESEVADLRTYLEQKHNERMEEINQFKQKIYGTKDQARVRKI